jgi:molybdate transport system substrate-binding protein
VLSKVQLGEADAGIVYATDVRTETEGIEAIPIVASENTVASYLVALMRSGENHTEGAAFLAFLLSEEGQAILQKHGFMRP